MHCPHVFNRTVTGVLRNKSGSLWIFYHYLVCLNMYRLQDTVVVDLHLCCSCRCTSKPF